VAAKSLSFFTSKIIHYKPEDHLIVSNHIQAIKKFHYIVSYDDTPEIRNLVGNPNYLRVHQDSVFAHLPFYGTRQRLQLGKNTGAIQLATIVQNYSSLYKEAKNRTAIHFEAKEGYEIYDVNITVFGNGRTTIHVNSSQRSSISYDGNIAAYPKH